jgi:hypothetical protein
MYDPGESGEDGCKRSDCNEPFVGADTAGFKLAEGGIYDSEGTFTVLLPSFHLFSSESAVNLWYLMNVHFENS